MAIEFLGLSKQIYLTKNLIYISVTPVISYRMLYYLHLRNIQKIRS